MRLPFHPDRLAFYFGVSLVPFFLAGMALSMLFAVGRENAGRLYFADLLGASLGALAVTFLLSWLGGENAVLAVSIAPLVAAALFAPRFRVPSAVAVAARPRRARASTSGPASSRSAARPTKGLYRHMAATPGSKIALTGWNAYSRIDAVTGFESPYLARLYIDSDAWTNILEWDGRRRERLGACGTGTAPCRSSSCRRGRRRSSSAPAAARTCSSPSPRGPRRSPRSR